MYIRICIYIYIYIKDLGLWDLGMEDGRQAQPGTLRGGPEQGVHHQAYHIVHVHYVDIIVSSIITITIMYCF